MYAHTHANRNHIHNSRSNTFHSFPCVCFDITVALSCCTHTIIEHTAANTTHSKPHAHTLSCYSWICFCRMTSLWAKQTRKQRGVIKKSGHQTRPRAHSTLKHSNGFWPMSLMAHRLVCVCLSSLLCLASCVLCFSV